MHIWSVCVQWKPVRVCRDSGSRGPEKLLRGWNIWQWELAVFVAVAASPSVVPRVSETWTTPPCQCQEPEHPPLCHSNESSPFIWETCQAAETGKETATLNWSEVDSSQRGLVWSGVTTWVYLLFLWYNPSASFLPQPVAVLWGMA